MESPSHTTMAKSGSKNHKSGANGMVAFYPMFASTLQPNNVLEARNHVINLDS